MYILDNVGLEISLNENIQDCEEVIPGTSYHSSQPSGNFEKSPRELLLEQQINELLKENTALKKKGNIKSKYYLI